MILWSFGGVDYTRKIQVPNYEVNRIPEYTQWTDGNDIDHRDISRQRISGTITVYFDSAGEQLDFLAALNAAIAPTGYLSCKLYAVNLNAVYDCDCFVDFAPKNELPLLGRAKHGGIQIKLTER